MASFIQEETNETTNFLAYFFYNVVLLAYEEVCGNLMIFQQLEPICQPINNTFCMEFTQLH